MTWAVLLMGLVMFITGAYGLMSRATCARLLASLELMLSGAICALVIPPYALEGLSTGQTLGLVLVGIDSTVMGVAIGLMLVLFRKLNVADVDQLDELRG